MIEEFCDSHSFLIKRFVETVYVCGFDDVHPKASPDYVRDKILAECDLLEQDAYNEDSWVKIFILAIVYASTTRVYPSRVASLIFAEVIGREHQYAPVHKIVSLDTNDPSRGVDFYDFVSKNAEKYAFMNCILLVCYCLEAAKAINISRVGFLYKAISRYLRGCSVKSGR